MTHRLFVVTIGLVLLISFSARSQQSSTLRELDDGAGAALRKKAIDRLESVGRQVDSLRSAENRARIGSNVAELLWNHDEKRSRSLFAAVAEDIKAGFNEIDSDYSSRAHTLRLFWKLRSETVGRIARHDPDLALEFLRATQPPADTQFPYEMRNDEKFLELRLASQIADKNPELALKLGRESLAKGFPPELLPVLSRLRWQNRQALLGLSKAIVDKLKSTNLEQDSEASEIALYIAHSFRPPEVDEQVYRDLIGMLLNSALAQGCGEATANKPPQNICSQVGSLFSRMEMYYGSRAAPLKRLAQEVEDVGIPSSEMWAQIHRLSEEGTVDEILALAVKYPERQAQIHWGAMLMAEASGDLARARKIASDFPDEDRRREMLDHLERNQTRESMSASDLAAIHQGLNRFSSNEDRLQFIFSVVSQIGESNRQVALGLLNQAGQIMDSTKPGKTHLKQQISLAILYCFLKNDRGFAIMESLMPRLNELVAAAASLDGLDTRYLRDGEWNMTSEGALGALLNQLAQNARHFAVLDFDRSVGLANQFERPELRLMAEVQIAKGVLGNRLRRASAFGYR